MIGIYEIKNNINGKSYVGQSKNISRRWKDHINTAFNANSKGYDYPLYRSFRKYGISNFSFIILELCDEASLDDREKFWISSKETRLFQEGYNQSEGGESCPDTCKKMKKELYDNILSALRDKEKFPTQTDIAIEFNISIEYVQGINTGRHFRELSDENITFPIRSRKNEEKQQALEIDKSVNASKYDYIDPIYVGQLVTEFNSIIKAAKKLNVAPHAIYKIFSRKYKELNIKTKNDIISWYCDIKKIQNPNIKTNTVVKEKKQFFEILMYSLDGVLEMEFKRLKDIHNYFPDKKIGDSHIYAVCNGKRKSAYGKIWKKKS